MNSDVVAPDPFCVPLTPLFLVATANAFVGLGEETGDEHGTVSDLFLRAVGLPSGSPWGTAFVHHAGYWSHFNHDSRRCAWPLPRTGDPNELARHAQERRVLRKDPEWGDILLLWSGKARRFIQSGIVLAARRNGNILTSSFRCTTLEGDVSHTGEIGGSRVRVLNRDVDWHRGDRFVRWADLDPRNMISKATFDAERLTVGSGVRRAA